MPTCGFRSHAVLKAKPYGHLRRQDYSESDHPDPLPDFVQEISYWKCVRRAVAPSKNTLGADSIIVESVSFLPLSRTSRNSSPLAFVA